MDNKTVFALDFDGVICDSAIETGISAWKAATFLWDDMNSPYPPQLFVDQFKTARALIETGYESIFVMRMFFQGHSLEFVLQHFHTRKSSLLLETEKSAGHIKQLFGEVRDHWIQTSLTEWIDNNPLFPGVADKLIHLAKHHEWYIVTTKQERFVSQIFEANNIDLAPEKIYGMDRKKDKQDILLQLINKHPDRLIYFVEDRLKTLLDVKANQQLEKVALAFAKWGYNTKADISTAQSNGITLLELEEFLRG